MEVREVLQLSSILSRGKKHVEELSLPYYNTKIKVRPLSRYEIAKCAIDAAALISDLPTRNQFMLPQEKRDASIPIRLDEMQHATLKMFIYIVYTSVSAIYHDVTIENIERLFNVEEIASHILEISAKMREKVDFFRKDADGKSAPHVDIRLKSKSDK